MNVLSLCSGIAGLDLGVKLAVPSARVVGYVEGEIYAAAVLAARMEEGHLDPAPIHSDVRSFDARLWRDKVDCIIAGFPCQPFSEAARGRNRTDLDLWPSICRCIQEASPWIVFLENVHVKAYREALGDLQRMDFVVAPPFECSSAELGAVHDRQRTFVLAYANNESELVCSLYEEVASVPQTSGSWNGWPDLPGMDDGYPHRLDRDRALGNAVIPEMAAFAFSALLSEVNQ